MLLQNKGKNRDLGKKGGERGKNAAMVVIITVAPLNYNSID
jgi:hypothetical protein